MGWHSCLCSLSQEPSLVRLSRLIYGPAGGACHDFLNLKSRPHPPISCSTLAAGRGLLHHLQLCEDMCAASLSLKPFLRAYMCVFPRVPRMFVMSTRVSYCMCYLCYPCVSVECVCVCVCKLGRGRFSPSLSADVLACRVTFYKVCILCCHTYFTCVQAYDTFHT